MYIHIHIIYLFISFSFANFLFEQFWGWKLKVPMIGDPSTSAATGEDATLLATASPYLTVWCLMPGLASNAAPPWAAAMLANLALGQPLSLDHSCCLKPTEILQLAQVAQHTYKARDFCIYKTTKAETSYRFWLHCVKGTHHGEAVSLPIGLLRDCPLQVFLLLRLSFVSLPLPLAGEPVLKTSSHNLTTLSPFSTPSSMAWQTINRSSSSLFRLAQQRMHFWFCLLWGRLAPNMFSTWVVRVFREHQTVIPERHKNTRSTVACRRAKPRQHRP